MSVSAKMSFQKLKTEKSTEDEWEGQMEGEGQCRCAVRI